MCVVVRHSCQDIHVAHDSQDYVFNASSQSWSCVCPALTKFTVTKQGGELELVPLVRRLSRSDKVSGIRLGAGHDTRSNKIHCNTAKLSSKVSLSEKVYCIIITERAVSSGPNDLPLRATILDRKGKEKVIPPFPQKLLIKPCKGPKHTTFPLTFDLRVGEVLVCRLLCPRMQ